MNHSGIFVSVDGPNGVGKSTIIAAIAQHLRQKRLKVHLTKEVTSTTLGKFIRTTNRTYRGKTLALLLAADRQDHVEHGIVPALQTHDFVVTDRYVQSSLVFQRLDGVESSFIWKINAGFLKPHLSICITASAEIIAGRLATRKSFDRFEESFSSEKEIRFFKEATSFLKNKGFNVRTFINENVAVEEAAEELANVLLRLRRKQVDSIQ